MDINYSKKKLLVIFLLLFSSFTSLLSANQTTPRLKVMGDIGIAVSSTSPDFFYNPAMLGFSESTFSMFVNGGFGDSFSFNEKNLLMPNPFGEASILFAGKMISAFISDNFFLSDEVIDNDIRFYNAMQEVKLGINYAFKISNFSFGAGIIGDMTLFRPDIRIADSNRFVDLFINGIFESYKFKEESEKLNIRIGMGFSVQNFTLGFLIPDFYNYSVNDPNFKPLDLLSSLSLGFYYSMPEYNPRGKLRNITGSAGLDIVNIGNLNEIGVKVGAEVKLQFTSDYRISLLAGYKTALTNFKSGTVSLGLTSKLRNFNINLCFFVEEFSAFKYALYTSYTI